MKYLQCGHFSKVTKGHLQDSTDLVVTKVTDKEKKTYNSIEERYFLLYDPTTENAKKKTKTKSIYGNCTFGCCL